MWTRAELKEKGRSRFTANYWKCVLAALLLSIVAGGSSGSAGGGYSGGGSSRESFKEVFNGNGSNSNGGFNFDISPEVTAALSALAVGVVVIVLIALVIGIALDILVFNPLEVSCKNFFVENLEDNANLSALSVGFSKNYKNVVKVMFFRDLFLTLWTLLCIIPGIIKSYEYRMIPYLLAENPDMAYEDAFAVSKKMMNGNKWDAFVLDLSFIGWGLLSALTCGILGIFYVNPYIYQTDAALYDALAVENGIDPDYSGYVEVE